MERRQFLKNSCFICLTGSAIASVSTMLSSCASLPIYTTNAEQGTISVPLSIFHDGNFQIIRAQDILYDIALKKENNGTYIAFPLLCTHASNPLTFTGEQFTCSLHGSKFNQEGNVTRGPATKSLTRLKTRLGQECIIISL
jgi:nitrite reductase/ring-hydroxylating ferredoxin subunit